MFDFVSLLRALTGAHGVSGQEEAVASVIKEAAAPWADEMERDVLGNLLVRKKGKGRRVLVSAHMDSVGLVATYVSQEGMIRVGAIGGVAPGDVLHHRVLFQGGAQGVICRSTKGDSKSLTVSDLYVDIGARDGAEAAARVQIGETAALLGETHTAGSRVISPYLDDRAGCLVMLLALQQMKNSPNDVTFAFTVQEEVGLRGAKTAAFAVEPDYGIAVDVTTSINWEEPEKSKGTSVLGGGAAIKVMDRSVICAPQVVSLLTRLAEERGIPAQKDIIKAGGTDAGPIQRSRAGVLTGGISIPLRNTHTPGEMADLGDIEACAALLTAFLEYPL